MKYLLFGIVVIMFTLSPITTSATEAPKAWKKCKACHTYEESGKNKVGPNLFGIIGRQAGTAKGFKKYRAMKGAEFIWDDEKMNGWLKNSRKWAKENLNKPSQMSVKIKDKQREELIEFLNTLK